MIKKIFIYSISLFLCINCQQKRSNNSIDKLKVTDLSDTVSFKIDTTSIISINIPQPPERKVFPSEFIKDFYYLPLETTDECLMGQYRDLYIINNHIMIRDCETNMVYIFDMNGKFISKTGIKGGGPGEIFHLRSMTVDPFRNHIIIYDNFNDHLYYYTLDGKFVYKKRMPIRRGSEFMVNTCNQLVFSIDQPKDNPQLNEVSKYNIIYTDSALNVQGGVYKSVNDLLPSNASYATLSSNEATLAFTAPFAPEFYEINETGGLTQKYEFDFTGFDNIFDLEQVQSYETNEEKDKYTNGTTRILPPIFFTDEFLWFKARTINFSNEFYCYVDRKTNKTKNFNQFKLDFDNGFMFESVMTSYKDYFVGYVLNEKLINLKEKMKETTSEVPAKLAEVFDVLQEGDNDVLVFFSLKPVP